LRPTQDSAPVRGVDLLAQMATFARIVEAKSLSAAARAQRLSLAAVSRQLAALEAELGAPLVVRSTRSLRVTDAGNEWYQRCVRILRDVDEARSALRGDQTARGMLVVSASLTFGTVVLLPRLGALCTANPELVVDLRLEDQLVDLVGEGVDVAIRAGSPPPDSTAYVAHPLFSMCRVLVASPRWLRKHGTPREPAELERTPCLVQVTPGGNVVRWSLRRGDETRQVEVRGPVRSNAPTALRDLAVDGVGVAYVPDWLVEADVAEGRLRRVLPAWSSAPIMAWALHRAELRGSAKLRAFLDALPREPGAGPRKSTRRRP
jgi:DNA-binding transcriptional LysR family regulator